MCLIAYVPAGKSLPEANLRAAATDNDDGIGIMSVNGIEKFLGKKAVKRAWRYVRRLHEANCEYAIHFRFATHGRVALANCHPFETPDGNAYVMHNGILSDYTPKDKHGDMSDTRNLVSIMTGVDIEDSEYWNQMAGHIGAGNKLCVMSHDAQFRIVNELSGDWIDGVWYSQTYSLPGYGYSDVGDKWYSRYKDTGSYATPARHYELIDGKYKEVWSGGDSDRDNVATHGGYGALVEAALERRYGAAGHSHNVPMGTYYETPEPRHCAYGDDDDAAMDTELERHIAARDDGELVCEPTDICPSCEDLHSNGAMCPSCGYIDMSDGMLGAYQGSVAK